MSSQEVIDAIATQISQLLKTHIDNKLTSTEFAQRCAKIYKEVNINNKKPVNVVKVETVEADIKPPNALKRWNLYVKQNIALMKEEDADKPNEMKRSSQMMLKIIAKKWKDGDDKTFMI